MIFFLKRILFLLYIYIYYIQPQTANAIETYNCESSMFHCSNMKCIPNQWVCDHEDDCKDQSDENICEHECDWKNEFRCLKGSAECMPTSWRCDGQLDCDDKSDEYNCNGTVSEVCSDSQFSCNGNGFGPCIEKSFVCDGHSDCLSFLDESNITCFLHNCDETNEFKCHSDGRCVSNRWVCDGDRDCLDGSDETSCKTEIECSNFEFKCNDTSEAHRCIPAKWVCDGTLDCRDKSDETNFNCSQMHLINTTCQKDEFQCKLTGDCIAKAWKCDNDMDCEDGSDEDDCTQCADETHRKCDSGLCILSSLWCDGIIHCKDKSDEVNCNSECDMVTSFDCGSPQKHICIMVNKTCDSRPDCDNGKDEAAELCSIDHSNDCKKNNGSDMCEHVCYANRIGMFCGCYSGYQLKDDNKTCEDINECKLGGHCTQLCSNLLGSFKCGCLPGYTLDPHDHMTCLLNGTEPVMLFSNRHDLRQIGLYSGHYRPIINDTRNIIAIDFDVTQRFLYLSDITLENITRFKLNGDFEPDAQFEVLAKDDIGIPDGLAYDWIHNNVYWTDTGKDRIEVMSLNNLIRHRQTLVDTKLDEPRAIVLDPRLKHRYMFWTDWGKHPKIERAFLDGSSRTEIVNVDIQWPNGLTIDYENKRLFWVDAKRHIIESSDFNGNNRQIILDSQHYLAHPFAISVFENDIYWTDWVSHSILKMSKHGHKTDSVSTFIHDLTSPMDLHVYHVRTQPQGENVCLKSKCSHICLPHGNILTPIKYTCLCPRQMKDKNYKMQPDNFTCLEVNTDPVVSVTLTKVDKTENINSSFSVPIIIALSVVLFAIIAILLMLIVRRLYQRQNIKTFNFDNPVYRRTTSESHVPFKYDQEPIASIHSTTAMLPLNLQSSDIV